MASLGFRPPQFSEDLAWLPSWLQNPQVESSDNHLLINSSNQLETLSRRGECTYNNFNLILSGDDPSQISVSPSPRNVVQFCLRLSLVGESQQIESQDLNISQPSAHCVETSAGLQERLYQSNALEKGRLQLPTNKEEIEVQNNESIDHNVGPSSSPTSCKENLDIEEKFNAMHIKEAVELSIAASEAVVIHELMCSGSTSEVVSAGAILEAALCVKQARLESVDDRNCCSSSENDEIDYLSDLDDRIMANAFLDVGISFGDAEDQRACGSDVSQVKDTPVSDYSYGHDNESRHVKIMVDHDKILNGSALGFNNTNLASLDDAISHHPPEAISHVPAMAQPNVDASSSPACISENGERGENVCSLVSDRFRSRWLGAWTEKKADTSAKLKQSTTKGIPRLFNYETSFFSESADSVADENSFVQKHETGSKIASQSSRLRVGLFHKADEGMLFSQETRSSDQSLVDPLCSVVPCSISSDYAGSLLAQNQDDREDDAQNCFDTKSELKGENSQRMSDINDELGHIIREAAPINTGEYFEAPVRRMASQKTYSKLLPKHEEILKGQQIYQNQLLSSDRVGEQISSNGSCQRSSNLFLPLRSELECCIGRGHGQNQDASVFRSTVLHHDEPAKDEPEQQLQPSVKRRSPLVLNRRTRFRLQPSELLARNLTEERTPEQKVARGTTRKAPRRKNIQKIKSKLKNPDSTPNLIRKRVRFSEVEVGLQQNKDIQEPRTLQKKCSASRANKRSKYSKKWTDSLTNDMKDRFIGRTDDMKRLIFRGLQFLLTGFSSRKEREIVGLIQEYGGMVPLDVPNPPSNSRAKRSAGSNDQRLPIVLCPKKLQTTKFLYGCAVNAPILKIKWLSDSIAAGSVIHPEKYMILSSQAGLQYTRFGKLSHHDDAKRIFDRLGIMLHGKHSYCIKLAIVIKHGGGQVFKTLQRLFHSLDTETISAGAIVAEDESRTSRHLRHCASERKIPMMPSSWIAKSLHFGKLLPFEEKEVSRTVQAPDSAINLNWSEEI